MSPTEVLKVVAKSAYYVASRAIAFGFLGLLLNLPLVVLLWPEISKYFHLFLPNLPHAGGPAVVIALVMMLFFGLPGILLAGTFAIGFPIAYLLLGKKHGITLALTSYLKDKKDVLLRYFFDRFLDSLSTRTEWLESVKSNGLMQTAKQVIPGYVAKLPNMPLPLRWLLRFALAQVKLDELCGAVLESGDLRDLKTANLSESGLKRASGFLDDKLFAPSLRPLLMLMAINLAVFAACKILL